MAREDVLPFFEPEPEIKMQHSQTSLDALFDEYSTLVDEIKPTARCRPRS